MHKHLKLVHSSPTASRKALPRNVATIYLFRNAEVHTNLATTVDKAVQHSVEHMRLNTYGATVAQIYNSESGELYATVSRAIGARITTVKYGE